MLAALLLTTHFAAGGAPEAPSAADYRREIEEFRRARQERTVGDEGWLTITGLFWLKEGVTHFGSAASQEIVLPARAAPARAGLFRLERGEVTVEVAPGVTATVEGQPIRRQVLRSDAKGKPDVLTLGPLRLFVIERGGQLAVRLRDLEDPARKTFPGLRWFPIRPAYRIVGRFLPHAAPRTVALPNVLGKVERLESPGTVVFKLGGQTLRLEAVYETEEKSELFFLFRDATNGRSTYGGGRFLYAGLPSEGRVVLDFNKAYTPPCAFTRFASCPLPPRQNRLRVKIEAGELNDGIVAH